MKPYDDLAGKKRTTYYKTYPKNFDIEAQTFTKTKK
jgi:hypothetical protein